MTRGEQLNFRVLSSHEKSFLKLLGVTTHAVMLAEKILSFCTNVDTVNDNNYNVLLSYSNTVKAEILC